MRVKVGSSRKPQSIATSEIRRPAPSGDVIVWKETAAGIERVVESATTPTRETYRLGHVEVQFEQTESRLVSLTTHRSPDNAPSRYAASPATVAVRIEAVLGRTSDLAREDRE